MSNVTYKMFTDNMGGTTATNYIGKRGEIFYDPTTTSLRISNGSTPGGLLLSTDIARGCFHKIVNVTAAAANTAYAFDWYTDTTAHITDGVAVASAQPTRVVLSDAGSYTVFVEMQAKNIDNQDRIAWIWLSKNGTPISETTIKITLLKEWSQVIAKQWAIDDLAANDYIEVNFAVNNASGISLEYNAAQTTPFIRPAQASAVLTVTKI